MNEFETLSETMSYLQNLGYTFDFNLKRNQLECKELNKIFNAEELIVDHHYRFEGDSNPDDTAILFAIHTNTGVKGLLVDAYGTYSDSESRELIKKLIMKKV